jgi:DNA-binding MarR family transcriptional regulator
MKPMSRNSRRTIREAPARGARVLRLGEFLPYRLNVLAVAVSRGLAGTYEERFGISVPEWRLLATLGEFHMMTAKAVGRHSHMNKVMVSRAASSLEKKGYLRRVPNEDDLREAFLVLTTKGKALYEEIAPLALDYVGGLTSILSESEQESLDRIIRKLMSNADGAASIA